MMAKYKAVLLLFVAPLLIIAISMWGPFEFLDYISRELLVLKKWPVSLGAYPGFLFTLEAGFIGKASVGKLSRQG